VTWEPPAANNLSLPPLTPIFRLLPLTRLGQPARLPSRRARIPAGKCVLTRNPWIPQEPRKSFAERFDGPGARSCFPSAGRTLTLTWRT